MVYRIVGGDRGFQGSPLRKYLAHIFLIFPQEPPDIFQAKLNKSCSVTVFGHCSATTLTGESRVHKSPPRGFEPVTLVAGSKQVSPLDQ
jgi:hypothetical protein